MLNTYTNQTFIGFDASFEEAQVVLFGAPFDGTTSFRPGTRFAPTSVRPDSYGLETYSPYLDLDLEDYAFHDAGDIDIPFGNTVRTLDLIEETAVSILASNKKPLMVGGEHLVTLPVIKALAPKYPDLCILHFDAHTDLREDYLGEPLSHACVIRRSWELLGDGRIYQFGIRSGLKSEFEWAKSHTTLQRFNMSGLKEVIASLKGRPVYLTIDLDILDPSVFPGTGTPEPGGITMKELLDALILMKELPLVGADVVELSPHYDASGISTAAACKVIREVGLLLAHW